jgi:predicted regulator of Ras-like GTPase activity (Roadblock/LC7/MglB family)
MTALENIAPAARRACAGLLDRLDAARAVIVCTEDGFQVAFAARHAIDAARLSAITSSMSAIGEVMSQETGIGTVQCVMVEADDGYLVMRSTRRDGVGLVVAAVVGREVLMGLVAHGIGELARELAN